MSAELLREAAALMRERAERAEQGRWKLWGMQVMADPRGTGDVADAIPVATAYTPSTHPDQLRTFNATHIATWHPLVALAVADLLDDVRKRHSPSTAPEEVLLHIDDDSPCEACDEGDGHLVTVCEGCYPAWEGTEISYYTYPCHETTAALAVARAYLGRDA